MALCGASATGLLLNPSGPDTSHPFEAITPSASPHVITENLSLQLRVAYGAGLLWVLEN